MTQQRIDILHAQLGFEDERICEWSLAHAVLSAWWSIENHGDWLYAADFAKMIASQGDSEYPASQVLNLALRNNRPPQSLSLIGGQLCQRDCFLTRPTLPIFGASVVVKTFLKLT
jgi:hypothetical protein